MRFLRTSHCYNTSKTDLLMVENRIPLLVLEILRGDQHNRIGSIPTINELLTYYFWYVKDADPKGRTSAKCGGNIDKEDPSNLTQILLAQELEISGVFFKAKRTVNFVDITFCKGILEMPVMSLDELFLLFFIYLLMFEFELHVVSIHIMQAYCYFMCCLLWHPDDVAVLRRHGIIKCNLSSDYNLQCFFFHQGHASPSVKQPLYFVCLAADLSQFRRRSEMKWYDSRCARNIQSMVECLGWSFVAFLFVVVTPLMFLGFFVYVICVVVELIIHALK